MSDRVFACPNLAASRLLAATVPVYVYEFADPRPPLPELAAGLPAGAYHASEVQYLLDATMDPLPLDPAQQELSRTMIAYWTNFARTGDLNGANLPAWRPFDPAAADPTVLALAPGAGGIAPVDFTARHTCDLWAVHGEPE